MIFMTDHPNLEKHVKSYEIAAQVRKFLRSGGKITKVAAGVMQNCETKRKSGDFSINGVDRKKRFGNVPVVDESGKARIR